MTSLIIVLDHVFIPLTIIIAITSVIGFLGNALAFYIFRFRFPSSGFNILMAALAVYDMLACGIHMPLDIATFYDIGFLRSYLCKITCFQLAFTATGAALILMAIASVRFMGICKPIAASFSTRSAFYVIAISALLSSGIALPITILFGDGELKVDGNVTARICAVEFKYMSTSGPIAYYLILASLYIITFICHTCLYTKSVIIIWERRKTFVTMKGTKNVMMSPAPERKLVRFQQFSPSASPVSVRSVNADVVRQDCNTPPLRRPQQTRSNTNCGNGDAEIESEMKVLSRNNSSRHQSKIFSKNQKSSLGALPRHDQHSSSSSTHSPGNATPPIPLPRSLPSTIVLPQSTKRETLTLSRNSTNNNSVTSQHSYRILAVVMAISITYFLSYAPHFGVMFYLFTHDEAVFTASAQSLVFELLMRSFFLNNILDPVIYGLLSRDFRRQAKEVLFCVCRNKS